VKGISPLFCLLVNPSANVNVYSYSFFTSPIAPPLTLAALGAALKDAGILVSYFDFRVERDGEEEFWRAVTDIRFRGGGSAGVEAAVTERCV
jgi:hypothetical protein